MKNEKELPALAPGLRLGVGRGQVHLDHFCPIEGQEGFWTVNIKQRIDSKWPFTAQLPIGFIEDLQRVEDLEKRHKAATEKARYWQNEAKDRTAQWKAEKLETSKLTSKLDDQFVALQTEKEKYKSLYQLYTNNGQLLEEAGLEARKMERQIAVVESDIAVAKIAIDSKNAIFRAMDSEKEDLQMDLEQSKYHNKLLIFGAAVSIILNIALFYFR